jgi:DNA-3-methyladenine glycosylase II
MTRFTLPRYGPKAVRHLKVADPSLAPIIDLVGPFRPNWVGERFAALGYSIISQQISTKAAASIRRTLLDRLGPAGFTPQAVLQAKHQTLRACGLSKQKAVYLRDLANQVSKGRVELHSIHEHDDEVVIEKLVQVKGIGRWTAEMFLIFALGRPDVLPVDDLGLRAALQRLDGLAELPTKHEVRARGQPWKPYSSVATWYLWQSLKYPEAPELSVRARRLNIKKRRR